MSAPDSVIRIGTRGESRAEAAQNFADEITAWADLVEKHGGVAVAAISQEASRLRGRAARGGRESCDGGDGYAEPTVTFAGRHGEGFCALAVALQHQFPVQSVPRYWAVIDGEPSGPDLGDDLLARC